MACETKRKNKFWWAPLAGTSIAAIVLVLFAAAQVRKDHTNRQAIESLKLAVQQSGAAIVILDDDGIVLYWSEGARELFGVEAKDAVGYGVAWMIPAKDRGTHREAFARSVENKQLTSGKSVQVIRCTAMVDGVAVPVQVTVRSYTEQGHLRFVAVFDKSERVDDKDAI